MEFLIMVNIFYITPRTGNLLSKQILQTKSIKQLYFLQMEKYIFGINCLIRSQTAIMPKTFKSELNNFRNNCKEMNLREHFFDYQNLICL